MIPPRRLRQSQEIASPGPWVVTILCLVVLSAGVSFAQEAGSGPVDRRVTVAIVPLTNITGESGDEWIGQGIAGGGAAQGIARNPGAAGTIQTAMIISLALIESIALYGLILGIMLWTKIP